MLLGVTKKMPFFQDKTKSIDLLGEAQLDSEAGKRRT
jgi:hypothetical protein